MYFKELEIAGFKSFLNKTKLKFEPGVTAVVGPNGCGKSNVVDSIKWVLGEQSPKSMRSTAMQDVIFNGTEKQEPVNMAEVSITLSNEAGLLPVDYDEVTITRRLFRSGESEYLINKNPVRLMDVRNLLMGTGIGTSSYSVIEQGRMDMVISSKPEDRRFVFEEASGITRYKSQKREALLKLERTEENLTRINDILREVERQIKSIERQARKAERYRVFYDELKDLEVKLACKKLKELDSSGTGVDGESENMRQVSGQLKDELEKLSAELLAQRKEYNTVLEDLQVSQSEFLQLSSEIDKNAHVIEMNRERIGELEKSVQRIDWSIEEAAGREASLRKRLEELEEKCSSVSALRSCKEADLASKEREAREISDAIERLREEVKSDREKMIDIIAEETQKKNAVIKTQADIHNGMSREKRLRMEKTNVESEKSTASERLMSAEELVKRITAELSEAKRASEIFNREYTAKQEKVSRLKEEHNAREKRLNEIKPRIEFIERLISEREGIGEGAKEVMRRVEAKELGFSGVQGILSEIISVHKGYEESFEAVFGEFSQALVVDSRNAAENVVRFLGENSLGSVSFVILDELMELSADASESPVIDSLSGAIKVLNAGEPYISAVRGMLKEIFVASTAEEARASLTVPGFSGRVICENGEVFQKGRHRSRNFSNKDIMPLFGRREKLAEMLEEEKRLGGELSSIQEEMGALEGWLRDSLSKKEELEDRVRIKSMEIADASSRMAAAREKYEVLAEESVLIDAELNEEMEVIKGMKEELGRLEASLKDMEEESGALERRIEEHQKTLQENSFAREKAFHLVSDIKVELSALRKEEEHLTANKEREKENYCRVNLEVEESRKRIVENGERAKALHAEIKALEARNEELSGLRENRLNESSEKKERKELLSASTSVLEKRVKDKEEKLDSLKNKVRDLDILKKEVEYKREAILTRVRDAYKVDLSVPGPETVVEIDQVETEAKIADLRDKIEKMGEVSLGAVEEHKELQERFAFLTKQRDDLVKAREDVMQAIVKINKTTRQMFMDTFEKIKKEFNVYFRMLFNGGKADLVLEDENDILECGIDIVVRPPGKKLQNIMLLSGGEKAMTAIALIFAIFKVNPSPFCILDEIDAPLDEANVVRFCRVLDEFLKLSQFIIVTHNRMTIQLADVLYGITMEEKGVSKVVSVKFSDENAHPENAPIPATA